MRNLLLILILSFTGLCGISAQDVSPLPVKCCLSSSVDQGDILIGVNSQISSVSLSDVVLQPTVTYGVTDNVFAGVGVSGNEDDIDLTLHVRSYFTNVEDNRVFGQIAYTRVNSVDTDEVSFGVGITGFIGQWFFLEPSFTYTFGDQDSYGVNVGFGVKL